MRGAAEAGVFDGLNGLERGAGGVFDGLLDIHRTAHRAGGVDAGAACFIREADEMRVIEAVFQMRQIRTLR